MEENEYIQKFTARLCSLPMKKDVTGMACVTENLAKLDPSAFNHIAFVIEDIVK